MMPMPMRRKTRDIEKVENLCRTATAWKILPAPEQAGSRPRDSMRAERRRAPSSVSMPRRRRGRATSAARSRPRRQADLERTEAVAQSMAREEGDGERGHDQIVVEHVGRRAAGARRSAAGRIALARNESFRRRIL